MVRVGWKGGEGLGASWEEKSRELLLLFLPWDLRSCGNWGLIWLWSLLHPGCPTGDAPAQSIPHPDPRRALGRRFGEVRVNKSSPMEKPLGVGKGA